MSIHTIESIVVRLSTDATRFTAGLLSAEHNFAASIHRMRVLAATFGTVATLAVGKVATDFDEAMTNVMATMREASPVIRRAMEDSLLNLSANRLTAPTELAKGFQELARRGYDAVRSMAALDPIERFAVVGQMGVENATRDLVRIQNGMNTASENAVQNADNLRYIGDVVTSMGYRAGGSMEAFAAGIAHLAPFLRYNNVSLEEGAALMAMFTSQSYDAARASQASMHFLNVIQRLSINSERGPVSQRVRTGSMGSGRSPAGGIMPLHGLHGAGHELAHHWQNHGVEVYNPATGMLNPLPEVVKALENYIGRLNPHDQKAAMMDLGFDRLIERIAVPNIGLSQLFGQMITEARRSAGMMEEIYAGRLLSFNAQFKLLTNNMQIFAIETGRILIPYMIVLNGVLKEGFDWWRGLSENIRTTVTATGLVVAGFFILSTAIPLATSALIRLVTILSPILLILSPLSLLLLAQYDFWNNLSPAITLSVAGFLSYISVLTIIRSILPIIITLYETLYAAIGLRTARSIVSTAASFVLGYLSTLQTAVTSLLRGIANAPNLVRSTVGGGLSLLGGGLSFLGGGLNLLGGLIGSLLMLVALVPLLAIVVMALGIIAGLKLNLTNPFAGWETDWDAIGKVLLTVIGFLYNIKENFNTIGGFIDRNFRKIFIDAGSVVEITITNIFSVLLSEGEYFAKKFGLFLKSAINDAMPDWIGAADARTRIDREGRRLDFVQDMVRRSGYDSDYMRGPRMRPYSNNLLADWSSLSMNTFLPKNIATFIASLPGRIANTLMGGGDGASHAEMKTVDFKEIALRRFVLETDVSSADHVQQVSAPRLERIVEDGIAWISRALGAAPPAPVGP